jgi:hypothetical protein
MNRYRYQVGCFYGYSCKERFAAWLNDWGEQGYHLKSTIGEPIAGETEDMITAIVEQAYDDPEQLAQDSGETCETVPERKITADLVLANLRGKGAFVWENHGRICVQPFRLATGWQWAYIDEHQDEVLEVIRAERAADPEKYGSGDQCANPFIETI